MESIWSALALIEDPEAAMEVHAAYIEAGADVLTINDYAVTPQILARESMAHRVEELTELAVDLVEQACSQAGRPPRLAGSFPPLETSYRADLVKGREEVLEGYRRIAAVLFEILGGLGVVFGYRFRIACVLITMVMMPAFLYPLEGVSSFESLMRNTWPLELAFVFLAFVFIGPGRHKLR